MIFIIRKTVSFTKTITTVLIFLFISIPLTLPHEFAHYYFRKRFGILTERIVLGNPNGKKIWSLKKVSFHYFGRNFIGGTVVPPNAERSNLPAYQQSLISFVGPLTDAFLSISFLMLAQFGSMLSGLFLYYGLCSQLLSISNMRKSSFDVTESDGQKIYNISKTHYSRAKIILLILLLINISVNGIIFWFRTTN
ncbi:site-2 protease family protein [Paenibacillus thiaminolyticus]|uniref:site-2 protease family protein n=1 Tax=Paenibacillus thiaminolyticus TaxID=49283 RepID=UPI003B97F6A6